MNYEIVVSRFKENTGWISSAQSLGYKITEYNKFEGKNLLQNVGKESHTYLTHIVRNYDNLADITIFLQGNPLEHCKNLFESLEGIRYQKIPFQYYGLSEGLITCDGNGRPHCGVTHLPLGKLYTHLFDKVPPDVFVCNSAGQFAVTKDLIRRNPVHLYEKCLMTLSYDINPIEGFCMERMWTSLFGFKNDTTLDQINYSGDANINIEEYLSISRDEHGNFIQLGKFGFNDLG